MERCILIPVRGRDRVEDILPYLDDIAQPGSKITFLVHLGTWQFEDQLDKLWSIQKEAKQGYHPATNSSSDDSLRTIRSRLKDVEVELKFYTGSLRALVDQLRRENRGLIVMLRPASNPIVRWLCKILYAWRFPQTPITTPVLLCHWRANAR